MLDAKSHVWHSKLLVNRQVSNTDGCKKFTTLANATLPSLSSLCFHKLCTLLYAIVIVKGVLKIHTVCGIRGPNFREKNKCPLPHSDIYFSKKQDGHVGFAAKVLVAIHYSVLAARNGYTRNAVV